MWEGHSRCFKAKLSITLNLHNVLIFPLLDEQKTKYTATATIHSTSLLRKWGSGKILITALAISLLIAHVLYQPTEVEVALKEQYQKLDEIDFEQYLPTRLIPFISPSFKIVDGFQVNGSQLLSVNQLLKSTNNEIGQRVAVIGRPGAGKSTFARHITKLWANGSALENINMLFHICLGRSSVLISDVQQLLEEECNGLIDSIDHEVQKLSSKIRTNKGEGYAFIIDGFDEYFPQERNDFLVKMIKGTLFPKSTVIVMSRPRGIEDMKAYFTMLVEIIGFSRLDIETSLLQLEKPLHSVIGEYFDNNPNVKKMCYLPLHMTMIIYLASLKEDTLSDIDTETKIYTNFLYLTIDHYNKRHGQHSAFINFCLEDRTVNHSLCPLFKAMCELAFNATIHRKQTFTSNELLNIQVTPETLEKLSLFYIKKENRRLGRVDTFAFSHPTFQEFMSAFFLVLSPKHEQQQMIARYGSHPALQDLVWKFFFGLIGEKKTEKTLKSLFRAYVSRGKHYGQLSTKYFAIDLYPLAYAFETGKRDQSFAELLDYARIVGPGNNYSLYIDVKEPMDLRSFLNIEDSGNTNINFLFMKYTLEWILVKQLRIELQLQLTSTIPDPTVCTNIWLLSNETAVNSQLQEVFKSYCNRTQTGTKHNISTVILELEYFQAQHKVVDPRLVFNMLNSVILPDTLYAQYFQQQMIQFLTQSDHLWKKKSMKIRPEIIFEIISKTEATPRDLNEEEVSFLQLWYHVEKYSSRIFNPGNSINFSELRKFKLQQLLTDSDLEGICQALSSAKKLEILDLSHNHLFRPKALVKLFSSLQQLQVLLLSDNDIQLNFIAKGFKFLKGLSKLDLSGNIFNEPNLPTKSKEKAFGLQLENLKELKSLDLSRIRYNTIQHLALGLKYLRNLRRLNLSSCLVDDLSGLEQLVPHLSSLKNLKSLDLSHNVIEYLSPEVTQALNQIRELNISHNMLNLPLSEIELFRWSFRSKLRRLNLSHNFLCGGSTEFQQFMYKLTGLLELREVDVSHNTLFLGNNVTVVLDNKVTTYIFGDGSTWNKTLNISINMLSHDSRSYLHTKSVLINSGIRITGKAFQIYADCICDSAGFEVNYRMKCSKLFNVLQHGNSQSSSDRELNAIHNQVGFSYLTGRSRSESEIDSLVLDRAKRAERLSALTEMLKTFYVVT